MNLKITKPLVTADWLHKNLGAENLLIFDVTIPKVTSLDNSENNKEQIKSAQFFDIKNVFSDAEAVFPNTVLNAEAFQEEVQKLGVHQDSCIVVYDDLGIYSSPRVWWMFTLMGFTNIAILDGGFPAWKNNNFPVEEKKENQSKKGNFVAKYQPNKICFTEDVLSNINSEEKRVLDARSEARFLAKTPEPRADIRGGHIPNSMSLPFTGLQNDGKMKSKEELEVLFKEVNKDNKELIFSCGSGITACVLALGAELIGVKKYSVYDGSWTEWGSRKELPIKEQ